jgi:hypothetical protein
MTTATETKTHQTTQAKIEQAVGMYSKMLAICLFEEQINDPYTRRPNAGTGALVCGRRRGGGGSLSGASARRGHHQQPPRATAAHPKNE